MLQMRIYIKSDADLIFQCDCHLKTWAGPGWKSELVSECSLVGEEMVLDTEIKPTSERTQIREFPCYDCISTVRSQIYICNNISNDQCFGRQSSVTFIKGLMSEYIFNYYSSACL